MSETIASGVKAVANEALEIKEASGTGDTILFGAKPNLGLDKEGIVHIA